jgi:hypothetical protein
MKNGQFSWTESPGQLNFNPYIFRHVSAFILVKYRGFVNENFHGNGVGFPVLLL